MKSMKIRDQIKKCLDGDLYYSDLCQAAKSQIRINIYLLAYWVLKANKEARRYRFQTIPETIRTEVRKEIYYLMEYRKYEKTNIDDMFVDNASNSNSKR